MERDIILPVKAAAIGMLIYAFYHGIWIRQALEEYAMAVQWTRYFLWYYIPPNILIAVVLLAMRRLPLGLVQWAVFISGLLDVILLSALIVLTLGFQSFLYWLFLGLIVRSAVSVPRATSQLALHLTIITCYVMAGAINISIVQSLNEKFEGTIPSPSTKRTGQHSTMRGPGSRSLAAQTNGAPAQTSPSEENRLAVESGQRGNRYTFASYSEPEAQSPWLSGQSDSPAEPLLVRLTLLMLMSACSYGVQVLLERQRQAMEEAREFATREGQLRAAGRLAAEFTHQMKNPLAIINTAAFSLQRALRQGRGDPAEQIRIIQEEVERSDRIITQIMGYAQLSEGHVEKLDIIEELDKAIQRVFPPGAGYPVRIHRDYTPPFPPLVMLRRHVSDTFINLLQNAREALEGQLGNVFVTARCRNDLSIEVSIRDDGPGIPPEKHRRVFEAYYTTKAKGTGLGLATVKHNVELYGGSVRVESELGKGACFVLLFPARALMRSVSQK
jgi:signal transduction histidine kinase